MPIPTVYFSLAETPAFYVEALMQLLYLGEIQCNQKWLFDVRLSF